MNTRLHSFLEWGVDKGVYRLEDSQLPAEMPNIVRAVAPGIKAALGTFIRSGQDRKNLEADHAFVHEMLKVGQTNFRYRGLSMEFEAFDEAHQEETKRLVTNTVNAMLKAESVVDWSNVNLDRFSPEFRRRWILEASNVSDETLQGLWARLLAGELESPGSVSNDTMSIARDLTKERAEEFQTFCSAALCYWNGSPINVISCGNPGSNSLRPYGLSYDILMRLAHHRLIVNDMTSYTDLNVDSRHEAIVRQQESAWILRWPNGTKNHRISGILFTLAGKELFPVVEKTPNFVYREAMLKELGNGGCTVVPFSNMP